MIFLALVIMSIPCLFYGFRRPILIDLVLQPDPNLEADYEAIERDGMSLAGEVFISFFGRNGSYIWAKASPLYDSNGNITGAIESLRTLRNERRRKMRSKRARANSSCYSRGQQMPCF